MTANNSPTLSLCSSSSKDWRTKWVHLPWFQNLHTGYSKLHLYLWTSKCLLEYHWVIEKWNSLDLQSPHKTQTQKLGVFKCFKTKIACVPWMLHSDRSNICKWFLTKALHYAFILINLLLKALSGALGRNDHEWGTVTLHMLLDQKLDHMEMQGIHFDRDVQVCRR